MSLLDVNNLVIEFPTRKGVVNAVRDISLSLNKGEILGVVGESGAGKSTIGNAVMDLLQAPGRVASGEIFFEGQDLRTLDKEQMRRIRGAKIGMIFQDPQTSLNPLLTQRVVIALAMCGDPDLIIADEPTTALDVSIQKQILDLIQDLCRERQLSVLLITHDIGVIAQIADRVVGMKDGLIVETGTTEQILHAPREPYTQALISAVPRIDVKLDRFLSPEEKTSRSPRGRLSVLSGKAVQASPPSRG